MEPEAMKAQFGLTVDDFETDTYGSVPSSSVYTPPCAALYACCATHQRLMPSIDRRFTLLPTLLHPKSRGSVRLRSNDPFDAPRIHPNYLDQEDDVQVLMNGVRIVRQIVASSVFDGIRSTTSRAR
jgi:choline dehydrogenase